MRLGLAQINPTVGDVTGNGALIVKTIEQARQRGVDLLVLPELCVCGYPPKDLLLQEGFVAACASTVRNIGERSTSGLTVVIGTPLPATDEKRPGDPIANSLVVYRDGQLLDYYDKRLLPTYDVFDENRYFLAGTRAVTVEVDGTTVGLAICEDLWKGEDAGFDRRYQNAPDPIGELALAGASLIVAPSASPFVVGKGRRHRDLLIRHATRHGLTVASVNQIGGNDDLVFDGHACVVGPDGGLRAAAPGFEEHLLVTDLETDDRVSDPLVDAPDEQHLYRALVLGVRDYCRKTGFSKAVLGLSGGIDSALTASIAVAALGPDQVLGASMPGRYSSDHSKSDAHELARRLGVTCVTMPIEPGHVGIGEALNPVFSELALARLGEVSPDVTEENLQSRIRGTLMMALSNRTGAILLTTGNKSELAVGYCTLYGDMNGGLAVLSDVTKLQVYRLSRWINANAQVCGFDDAPIPEASITKPPSAELAPDQLDSDSLPPYEVLDEIIERHVEARQSISTITQQTGFDHDTVARVVRLIAVNEYKRKQTAIGLKVSSTAFGQGRRIPIAQRWAWDHPSGNDREV